MRLIALAGRAGSGKDTVADHLVKQYQFTRYAFARPLKDEVAAAFGLDLELRQLLDTRDMKERPMPGLDLELRQLLDTRDMKERPMPGLALENCNDPDFVRAALGGEFMPAGATLIPRSWRWVCQKWGTEYRREQDAQYWIARTAEFIVATTESAKYDPTGWPQGVVITDCRFPNEARFVNKAGGQVWQIERPGVEAVNAHASETPLDPDFIARWINNTGTIADLNAAVDALMDVRRA